MSSGFSNIFDFYSKKLIFILQYVIMYKNKGESFYDFPKT